MRKAPAMRAVALVACGAALTVGLTGFANVDDGEANAADAVAAIQELAPSSLAQLAITDVDQDTAAQAVLSEGVTVSVPADAADGISLGDDVLIGLPFAERADAAAASPVPGVVAYDNNNGSTTVPLIRNDGAVQINTVIDNARAPRRYDYSIAIPDGASLVQSADGVVAIVTADGSPLRVFGDAWAKDANGDPVPTHYEVHGTTLTQVVDFPEDTVFPVVADPTTTGVYSYNCVLQNGSSYFLKPGERLSNCKGSRLQKYINGKNVQTIALNGYGYPGNPAAFGTLDCVVAILGAAGSVYGIGGAAVLTAKGAVAWLGLGTSVYGLKSCAG